MDRTSRLIRSASGRDDARLRQRYEPGKRIVWASVAVNVGLGLAKCAIGYWGHSRALVADGLHSLTDLATDAAVLFGIAYATRPPDEKHPYGHHRAANLVTFFIAGSLLIFCALLLVDSIRALHAVERRVPHWPTLVIALISIAVKEWLYYYTRIVGRRLGSQMLIANAWHHRTDSFSSLLAAIGIAAVLVLGEGWAFLDTVIGIALGGYLGLEGFKLLRASINDLMDATPGQSVVDDLREHILEDADALAYHDFRARRVGDMIEIDFHLSVNASLSIQQAHEVASRIKRAILANHPEVLTVLIHVEPALPGHIKDRGIADSVIDPHQLECAEDRITEDRITEGKIGEGRIAED